METVLTPKNIKDIYELSPMQEGMFFHALLDKASAAHFEQISYDFYGDLEPALIERSLQQLLARHDVLRTIFNYEKGGRPLQIVLKEREAVFHYEDISEIRKEEQAEYIRHFKERDVKRSFDLAKDVMFRLAVFKLAGAAYQFVWSFHHILMDGWCMGIAASEFYQTYYSIRRGRPLQLPPARSYRTYIEWLGRQDRKVSKSYWQTYLQGFEEASVLPRAAGADETHYADGRLNFSLSKAQTDALRKVAARNGVTLNILVQVLWGVMLARYTGRKDVLFGSIISGRPSEIEGIETMIGLFINTIPMRVRFDDQTRLGDLLRKVQREFISGEPCHYLPLADIQHESELKTGLFDHILVFENYPVSENIAGAAEGEGRIDLKDLEAFVQTNYPFNVILGPEEELSVKLAYNRNVYDPAFVAGIRSHFGHLADQAIREENPRVESLSLLSPAEGQALLAACNPAPTAYPAEKTMPGLFEECAARTPEATALSLETREMTYGALNRKANQLAHYLRSQYQVQPNQVVGIMLDRSERMIIGILGVLKAGAAYLPIDPGYPEERIKFILDDAGVKVLLTDSDFMYSLGFYEHDFVALDIQLESLQESTENPRPVHGPRDLAYVIYTSGSTGRPKGVMIEHTANVNMALDQVQRFGITERDHILQFASLSFDASVYEIFMALYAGATLVLATKETINEPDRFVAYLKAQRVSVVTLPPAYLRVLDAEQLAFLRVIITAGEAADVEQAAYCSRFGTYYNAYGPTECAVCVSVYRVQAEDRDRKRIPVGKPLSNTSLYILNDALQLLPAGVEGEICVAGAGLARGYLNRPDLTAQKFVDNPFAPGTRLYRTGDIGRWLPDGNVEFIRRKDTQVKIRGYRIETGEIEHVLRQHPAVEDAHVHVVQSEAGEKSLAAVLTPRPSAAFTLRHLLRLQSEKASILKHRHTLPNGMVVFHKNKGETSLIYQEIFEAGTYTRHGITIADGDVVFDVGANIGLFSLFAGLHGKNTQVYAFEPIGPIYEFLVANAALYGIGLHAFNYGISDQNEVATFTYYPHNTAISGRYGNEAEEKEVVRNFMRNESHAAHVTLDDDQLDEILAERMTAEAHEGQLRRLSDVIRETGVERIDLLKIDVEKSELDVLNGIDPADWQRIRQVVIEVHDIADHVKTIGEMLARAGFTVHTEQESVLTNTNIFNVYGTRPDAPADGSAGRSGPDLAEALRWVEPKDLAADVRAFCAARLPEYMLPADFRVLPAIPLTINGKVDQKALRALSVETEEAVRLPTNDMEARLAALWREILERDQVGICDNFFEIGGHSLKATQLVSRIHKDLKTKLELKDLFANPTVESLAHFLLHARQSVFGGIEPVAPQDLYDVSNAQRRLWVLYEMDEQRTAYNMPVAVRLKGELDVAALDKTLRTLVARHESLRTNFVTIDGEIRQRICPPEASRFALALFDVSREADPRAAAQRYIRGENEVVFDLEKDPLVRAVLVQLAPRDHVFVLNQHHIISDAWSLGVMIREINTLYGAYCDGNANPLPPLRIQYKDYTAWHNRTLHEQHVGEHRGYWLERFAGEIPVLRLPTEKPRPAVRTFNGKNTMFSLDRKTSRSLNEMGQRYGCSLFMTLLASTKALFHRYTGQEDIVIGSLIAGREHPDLEDQIGFYVNTLALRTTFSSRDSFAELLRKVKDTTLGAYQHQVYPFDRLIDDLNLGRNISRSPLFDVMVGLENPVIERGDFELFRGVDMEVYTTEVNTSKFDLVVDFEDRPDGIQGVVGFNTDVFSDAFVERFIRHYKALLTAIIKDCHLPVGQLEYLGVDEQKQLLLAFNNRVSALPAANTIHEMFEAQVRRTPGAEALAFGDKKLTYAELNATANRLARYLRSQFGVQPNDIVGLMLHKSERAVIGMLGILKAGGAYLPVDPAYPEDRIAFTLADAGVKVLLTDSDLLFSVGAYTGGLVALDIQLDGLEESGDDPEGTSQPADLAYVIYTSGSTGRPKGVMIEHRSSVNMTLDQVSRLGITGDDRVLQFASLSFDASVSEVFMALYAGAALVVMPTETTQDGPGFPAAMREAGVTVVTLPPAYLKVLPLEDLRFLRVLLTAGEAADVAQAGEFSAHNRYFNAYGPTECAVCVSMYQVQPEDRGLERIPVGKPVANTMLYVLDAHHQLVPVGVEGEICVSGIGLARGYVGQPALTASTFIPNPFRPGERLYKTGDTGKWLPDGNLVFTGRKDNQLKVRGYRIEPEEVEHALLRNKSLEACAVTACEVNGDKQLVAYYKPKNQIELWPSVAEYYVYDDLLYKTMAEDEPRNARYRNALRKVVKDKVVLEIGPGAEAILSRIAVEEGARKVYAVELLEASYQRAKKTVEALGLTDKIIVLHGDITTVTLPEPADYCVSEIVGAIGGSEGSAKLVNAARRLLKDPACMIPARSETKIAAVTLPEGEFEYAFEELGAYYVNKVFEQIGHKFDLRVYLHAFPVGNVISSEDMFERLDYTRESKLEDEHEITLEIGREAVLNGFIVWLELYCDEAEHIDTLRGKYTWLPIYLPVFDAGEKVQKGDYIRARVVRTLSANGLNPEFVVRGALHKKGNVTVPFEYTSVHSTATYRGDDFYAKVFEGDQVRTTRKTTPEGLRESLGRELPAYMVPALFVEVDRFPLTLSGKIDRKALPRPADPSRPETAQYAAPATEIEKAVAAIWQRVLGVARVGVDDNFFDIGGNSLNATTVVSALFKETGLKVGLIELFNHPTLGAFAGALSATPPADEEENLVMALNRARPSLPNLFLIPPIVGTSILFKQLAGQLDGKLNCYGLQCKGFEGDSAFDDSIEAMARTFTRQIVKVQESGEYLVLGYSVGGAVAYEITRQLEASGNKVKLIILDHMVDTSLFAGITAGDIYRSFDTGIGRQLAGLIDPARAETIKQLMVQNYANMQQYAIAGRVDADVLALEARDNVKRARMERWQDHTRGSFRHQSLYGSHDEMITAPALPYLLVELSRFLGVPCQPVDRGTRLRSAAGRLRTAPRLFALRAACWLTEPIRF